MPYLRIQIGKLYKVEPTFTIHIIRLMAAANDFNTVASAMLGLPQPKDHATELQIKGERAYFFRLASGHLHEAIQVVKELGKDCAHIFQAAPSEFGLEKTYSRIATTVYPLENDLARLRHHAVFHYDASEVIGVLDEWGPDAEGEIVVDKTHSKTRHSVADEVLAHEIWRIFKIPPDDEGSKKALGDLFDQLVPLQTDVMECVLGLLHTVRKLYPELIQFRED